MAHTIHERSRLTLAGKPRADLMGGHASRELQALMSSGSK